MSQPKVSICDYDSHVALVEYERMYVERVRGKIIDDEQKALKQAAKKAREENLALMKKYGSFPEKLAKGHEVTYYEDSACDGFLFPEFCALMHILKIMTLPWFVIHLGNLLPQMRVGLYNKLGQAQRKTFYKGQERIQYVLSTFAEGVQELFADGLFFSEMLAFQEFVHVLNFYNVDISVFKNLSKAKVEQLILSAKIMTRSGIVVPMYGNGNTFYTRSRLVYAENIFSYAADFKPVPEQEDLYEELRAQYHLIVLDYGVERAGKIFNDPVMPNSDRWTPPARR